MEVGQDYGEDIESTKGAKKPNSKEKGKVEKEEKETKGAGKPYLKEKEKVEKKGKKKVEGKSKLKKKGSGVNSFKKLNRQSGCGFWGTIGCNRSIMLKN